MNTDIKLILPKKGVVLNLQRGERLYFLAGPIRGANDWQATAIKMLHEKDPFSYVACPCRYDFHHDLFQYHLKPTELERSTDDERELPEYALEFPNQTMWERYYLEQASWYGATIFWLPCEDQNNPRKKEDGPYARDTYGELGRWSQKSAKMDSLFTAQEMLLSEIRVNLSIGAEEGFHGLSVIQRNFDADHGRPFPIYKSLEETISEAVKLGKRTNPQPMNFLD